MRESIVAFGGRGPVPCFGWRGSFRLNAAPADGASADGFLYGAEHALEAGAGELYAYQFFAFGLGIGDVHDAALSGEVSVIVSGA